MFFLIKLNTEIIKNIDSDYNEKEWIEYVFWLCQQTDGEHIKLTKKHGFYFIETENNEIAQDYKTNNHCYDEEGNQIAFFHDCSDFTFDWLYFDSYGFWKDEKSRLMLDRGKMDGHRDANGSTLPSNPYYDQINFYYVLSDFDGTFKRIVLCNGDECLTSSRTEEFFQSLIQEVSNNQPQEK